jgi:hypothetical protein
MGPEESWASASDLADYAYCPRSHWYRHHPPAEGPSSFSQRSARGGIRYHERVLTAERHRAERGGTYWAVLLLGLALTVLGAWWVFRP